MTDESDFAGAVFQVLRGDARVAGAGFLVQEDTAVTCAHVVRAAGQGPGGMVEVAFPKLPGTPRAWAQVDPEGWREPETRDVAVLRLDAPPGGTAPLPVGVAAGCRGHRVASYGFPAHAPDGGHLGFATVAGTLADPDDSGTGTGDQVQLVEANDLTTGFSGGPVLDTVSGLVIGMVTAITSPDEHSKGLGIAYATPAEVLREALPLPVAPSSCPYMGLKPFTARQAQWFHGRKDAADKVVAALRGNRRLLMLLGPSGAGKSSLVNAGVLPILAKGGIPGSDRWLALRARPGQDLLAELEDSGLPGTATEGLTSAARARLHGEPDHDHLLLVIDQFEELLTQPTGPSHAHSEDRRLRAIDQLVELSKSHTAMTVLLVMRNDFYAPLSKLAPDLLTAALPGLCNVPETLNRHDLQEIITRPAAAVGLSLAPDLADRIIDDVLEIAPETQQAPVTLLPPLQLALEQLWVRRDKSNGRLTHEAYQQMGKVTGSLSSFCNHALGELPANQQPTARRILTALVRPADEADGIPATRRRVPLTRLRALASGPRGSDTDDAFDDTIASLTRDRIITTDSTTAPVGEPPGEPAAELIHDALIRGWADLRDWVAEDRQFHVWLQRATDQQASHAQSELPEDLLNGSLLSEGEKWADQRPLPAEITTLLETSQQHQRSQLRRTKRINAFLATALALVLIAAGAALQQRQTVIGQRDRAASAQVASTAESFRRADPQLARRLAVASARLGDTPESRSALFTLSNQQEDEVLKLPHFVASTSALDETGHTLIAAGGTRVGIWDVDTRRQTGNYNAPSKVRYVTLSADGRTAAVSTEDGKTRLLDATNARPLSTHTYPSSRDVHQPRVALSPHGTYLRTEGIDADAQPTMAMWDTRTAKKIITTAGGSFPVWNTSFSPDERILSLPYPNGKGQPFTWYDTRTKKKIAVPDFKLSANAIPGPVVFSPDGKLAALSPADGKVRLYHRAEGYWYTELTRGDDPAMYPLHFSQDGRYLVQGGVVWETGGQWESLMRYSTTDSECFSDTGMLFTADNLRLRCVGIDGAVRSLDVSTVTNAPKGTGESYSGSAVSADRRTLALLASSSIEIWSPLTHTKRTTIRDQDTSADNDLTLSADGRLLAVQSSFTKIEIWDLTEEKKLGTLPAPLDWEQRSGALQEFAFSPDNRSFAAQTVMPNGTNALRFWDLTTMHQIRDIRANLGYDGNGSAVLFDPSGTSVIAAPNFGRVAFPSGRIITKGTGNLQMNAISDDGSTVYTYPQGSQPYLRALDAQTLLPTGEDLRTGAVSSFYGHTVAVSPDGRLFATVELVRDGQAQIMVWDGRSHSQLGPPFTGTLNPYGSVIAVTFTPDGSMLTSVDKDGRFLTHAVSPAKLIRELCMKSGSLTEQEWKAHVPDVPYRKTC